jgi:hypothetical protein
MEGADAEFAVSKPHQNRSKRDALCDGKVLSAASLLFSPKYGASDVAKKIQSLFLDIDLLLHFLNVGSHTPAWRS